MKERLAPLWSLRPHLWAHRSLFYRVTATAYAQLLCAAGVAVLAVVTTTTVIADDPAAPGLLVGSALAVAVLGWLTWTDSWVAHLLAYRVIDALRLAVHAALARLAPLGLGRRRSGETASAAMADAEQLEWFLAHTVAQVIAGLGAAATLTVLATGWLGWPGLLLAAAQVLVLVVPWLLMGHAERQGAALRTALAQVSAEVVEARQAARDLVLLGLVDRYRARVGAGTREVQRRRRVLALRTGLEQAVIELVVAAAALAALLAVAAVVADGDLPAGRLPAAVVLIGAGLAPCLLVAAATVRLGEMAATAARVAEVVDAGAVAERSDAPRAAGTVSRPGVQLVGLRYTYPGTAAEVLRGVDLDVGPGEHVALVGASGAGKTTLLHLVAGLLSPTAGTVAARGRVGLVGQHPHVFRRSLRDNLRLAAPGGRATDDHLLEVLDRAGLAEHVTSLPEGLDTVLGEHGATWSGGQRQRLGLARGFLLDPDVLVLDEPTANLDGVTEQRFLDTLATVRVGATTLVASHRDTTLRRFDRVVFLDDGRVADDGPHDVLLARSPRYASVLAQEAEQAETTDEQLERR